MTKNPQIAALNELGQSVWYDNLSRDVLRSGELARIIEAGVSGLTSNPTIFKLAIADTSNYDDDIRRLAREGHGDAETICEALMVADVGAAADLLRPIYDRSEGGDGFASIEVSPDLARDTAQTVEVARRLWKSLARPNIMIKVPATEEGIPAIRTLLEEGINVNITLIFSVEVYEQVAEAYIAALEARRARGLDVSRISSVASFFVSRVDAIHEARFDALVNEGKARAEEKQKFWGKIGIANSKLAYAAFERLFNGERFAPLAAAGAKVQRPLWASTGTKNPKFSKVLYVEELAGAHTVNTMPPATLTALLEGAQIEPRLHQAIEEARGVIATVRELGLPFDELLLELQSAGVKLFAESYRDLLASIEQKREQVQ